MRKIIDGKLYELVENNNGYSDCVKCDFNQCGSACNYCQNGSYFKLIEKDKVMTFEKLREELIKSIERYEKESVSTIDRIVIETETVHVNVDGSNRTVKRTIKAEIS